MEPTPLVSGSSGSKTILVVDDEPSVLSFISVVLNRGGYFTLQAANGAQALEICNGKESDIHLLVTDVMMPSISGPQLADRLLAQNPEMGVIFTSGYDDYHFEKYRPFSFKRLMRKPFTPNLLLATVREALDEPRKRAPGRETPVSEIRKAYG